MANVYKLQNIECIFPIDNIAHVRSRKSFYHISVNFRNPGNQSHDNRFLFSETVRPLVTTVILNMYKFVRRNHVKGSS